MAKRKRRKQASQRPRKRVETAHYEDAEGNVLRLRKALSPATIVKLGEKPSGAATTIEDAHHRREEMLFERLVVSWEISGLEPLTDQKLLLGRFRMASPEERRWIRESIAEHVGIWIPGVDPGP